MSEETAAIQMENLNKMKVADIKKLLKSQGLSTHGNKSDLIQRLKSANDTTSSDSFLETSGVVDNEVFDEDLEEDLDETELMSDEKEEVGQHAANTDKSETDADPLQPTDAATPTKKKGGGEQKAKLSEEDEEEEEEEEMMEEDEEAKSATSADQDVEEQPQQSPQSPSKDNVGAVASGREAKENNKAEAVAEGANNKETTEQKIGGDNPQHPKKKLAKRAEKFGLTEAAKKEMRAARFGIQTPASMTELLKKRAERFGLPVTAITNTKVSLVSGETDVLKKRAQRFGIASSPSTGGKVEKKSVTAKIGGGGGGGKLMANSLTSVSAAERRLIRSVRFKVAATTT